MLQDIELCNGLHLLRTRLNSAQVRLINETVPSIIVLGNPAISYGVLDFGRVTVIGVNDIPVSIVEIKAAMQCRIEVPQNGNRLFEIEVELDTDERGTIATIVRIGQKQSAAV